MSSDAKTTQAEGDRFFSAAKMMSLITVISRVTGMLRDMAIASLGANRLTDTFVFAFRIPTLFRRLFGEGALTGAFVPIFSETAKNDGEEKANRLLANSMGLLTIFLTALMLAIQVGLAVYGWHKGVWAHPTPENFDQRLMLGLTAIMLPFMVSICMLALGSAALNCRAHFFYPVFAPVVLNICIISAA